MYVEGECGMAVECMWRVYVVRCRGVRGGCMSGCEAQEVYGGRITISKH